MSGLPVPTLLPLAPSPPPCGTPGSGPEQSSKLAKICSRSSATSLTRSSGSRIPDCDCSECTTTHESGS